MLMSLVKSAIDAGSDVDLSGCVYGRNQILPSYYLFLAGLVYSQKLSKILEVGTFMGGSSLAMFKGASSLSAVTPHIVTVDLEQRNVDQILGVPQIHRVIGNPLALPVLDLIVNDFGPDGIDFLFLDSTKVGRIVLSQFFVLSALLRPRFVVLDDITLNPSMVKMWDMICRRYKENSMNLAEYFPEIRKQGEINPSVKVHPGLGIVRLR
jgi:predicted O-methyltransferase YrrM